MGQRVALYARISTADQSCERQICDLEAFAARAGDKIVATFRETGSGARTDRFERKKVLAAHAAGRSYRWIARDLGLSKNIVMAIVRRSGADVPTVSV